MKMSLTLYSDPVGVADIERFAFTPFPGQIDDYLTERAAFSSVDIDPLIPEQSIRVDMGENDGMVNYAVAEYLTLTDEFPKQKMDKYPPRWFFYVTSIERKRSSSVCIIHLKLDGVTTLFNAKATAINNLFTRQCFVKREHRDRFLYPSSGTYTTLQYNIDKIHENIPVTMKKTRVVALDNDSGNKPQMKWYIVYKSKKSWSGSDASSSNSIETFFLPHDRLKVSSSSSSGTGSSVIWDSVDEIQFSVGNWYYLSPKWSPGFHVFLFGDNYYASSVALIAVCITAISGSDVTYDMYIYGGNPGGLTSVTHRTDTINVVNLIFSTASYFRVLSNFTTDFSEIEDGTTLQINAGTTSVAEVDSIGFSDLDRTDPLLVKVIEAPYCPAEIRYNATNYSLENCSFDQATKMFKPSSTTKWRQLLRNYDNNTLNIVPAVPTYEDVSAIAVDDEFSGFDPKLLHSDFYALKVVYDTFAVSVELENTVVTANASIIGTTARQIRATWHFSPDINSVFLISANCRDDASDYLKSKTQDFGQFAVVDRNNEKPLFTNAYLNYMRVGYNYDQKSKALQNWAAVAGVVASAAGAVVGMATGQAPVTAMSIASLISSASGLGFGVASREVSMQAKLAELKAQGTSVAGVSDVAILDQYCPQARFIEYRPDPEVISSLAGLFHLYGYATGCFKKPDVMSRSLWNYLEADVVLDQSAVKGIPQQVAARAIEQFRNGVTIMHSDHDILDMTQQYENWEEALL